MIEIYLKKESVLQLMSLYVRGTQHVVIWIVHGVDCCEYCGDCGEYGLWRLIVSLVRI